MRYLRGYQVSVFVFPSFGSLSFGTYLQFFDLLQQLHCTASMPRTTQNIAFFALRSHSSSSLTEFPHSLVSPLFLYFLKINDDFHPCCWSVSCPFSLHRYVCVSSFCIGVSVKRHRWMCLFCNVCTLYMCRKVQDFHGKIQAFWRLAWYNVCQKSQCKGFVPNITSWWNSIDFRI